MSRHTERRPPHPSQSVFSEGWSNAQAVAQLPECPPTQGDIQWDRNPPYDPEGDPYIFHPTVAGPYGPGQPLPMSGNEGCGVLDQPRHQSWDSYALGDSMSPPLIPETPGDPLSSIGHQAHQFGPLGGPSAMPWIARHPEPYFPISTETYNSPPTVFHTLCPIGLGGSQILLGVNSPSDQNNQRSYPINAYPLADEIPHDEPYMPYDRTVQSCGWRCDDGTLCGVAVTFHCQGHLASSHGITKLSGKTPVWCKWCCPDHQIKRECLLRHIREVHLGFPRSWREHA